jgi:hypothetical protein
MKHRAIIRSMLAVCVVALAPMVACEVPFYVYSARPWNAADACVEPYVPVDRVDGEGAGSSCPAVCLSVGRQLYVSTVCPPLPPSATEVAATDPSCRAALDALNRNRVCGGAEEGGVDGAAAGEDASDASGDVSTDALDGADARDADAEAGDAPSEG